MPDFGDDNLQQVLDDPGAYFDQPESVANAALSAKSRMRILDAWRRWLESDEWQAPHTDEKKRQSDLEAIEEVKRKILADRNFA